MSVCFGDSRVGITGGVWESGWGLRGAGCFWCWSAWCGDLAIGFIGYCRILVPFNGEYELPALEALEIFIL